jgi:hypothetical protein
LRDSTFWEVLPRLSAEDVSAGGFLSGRGARAAVIPPVLDRRFGLEALSTGFDSLGAESDPSSIVSTGLTEESSVAVGDRGRELFPKSIAS